LQWRAAVPTEMWLSTVDDMSISHVWHGDKRDMVLAADGVSPPPVVEPRWSLGFASVRDDATVGNGFWYTLEVDRALKSMHLSNDLSEDVIRHFAEPMLRRLPEACLAFVVQGPDDTESVAHSLLSMWLTSALATDAGDVARAYTRAAVAVAGNAWGPAGETNPGSAPAIVVFLKSLAGDVPRLPAHLVVDLVEKICSGPRFDARSHAWSAIECVTRIDPDDIDPESRHALFRYLEAFMVTGIDVELEPRAFPARRALQEWANSRQAGPEIARQPDEGAGWSA
jgi:hypothetical protein